MASPTTYCYIHVYIYMYKRKAYVFYFHIFCIQMRMCLKKKERNISFRLVREIWKLLVNFMQRLSPCFIAMPHTPYPFLVYNFISAQTFGCVSGLSFWPAACIASAMAQIWNPSGMLRAVNQNQRGKLFQQKFTFPSSLYLSRSCACSCSCSRSCPVRGSSGLCSACLPDWKRIKNEI